MSRPATDREEGKEGKKQRRERNRQGKTLKTNNLTKLQTTSIDTLLRKGG